MQQQIAEKRDHLTPPEVALPRRFADPDEPFSLMFSCLLKPKGFP